MTDMPIQDARPASPPLSRPGLLFAALGLAGLALPLVQFKANRIVLGEGVLLGNAIKGNHVGILETVEITAHHGGGLKVNKVSDAPAEVVLDEKLTGDSLDNIEKAEGTTVDATQVATAVATAQASGKSVRQVTAEKLYSEFTGATLAGVRLEAAKQLLDYKKRAKVSWDKLGLNQSVQEELVKAIEANGMDLPETVAEEAPVVVTDTGNEKMGGEGVA